MRTFVSHLFAMTGAVAAQGSPNSELGQWFYTDSEGSVPAAPLNMHYM